MWTLTNSFQKTRKNFWKNSGKNSWNISFIWKDSRKNNLKNKSFQNSLRKRLKASKAYFFHVQRALKMQADLFIQEAQEILLRLILEVPQKYFQGFLQDSSRNLLAIYWGIPSYIPPIPCSAISSGMSAEIQFSDYFRNSSIYFSKNPSWKFERFFSWNYLQKSSNDFSWNYRSNASKGILKKSIWYSLKQSSRNSSWDNYLKRFKNGCPNIVLQKKFQNYSSDSWIHEIL